MKGIWVCENRIKNSNLTIEIAAIGNGALIVILPLSLTSVGFTALKIVLFV